MRRYLKLCFTILSISCSGLICAQEIVDDTMNADYYREIPDYPETYSAHGLAARMVDGLGFRFYWATDGLSEEDYAFRVSEEARSIDETVRHVYNLIKVTHNAVTEKVNTVNEEAETMGILELRAEVLNYIRMTSDVLKQSEEGDMEKYKILFERGDTKTSFPFWNLVNGPIADALWHCGQIVMLRREAGNPVDSRISFLLGSLRED